MGKMYTKAELCRNAGITPETLRHYLDIGLIKPKEITEKGYRKYDRDTILDLWFYRLGASLGNPLKEVKKWNTAMSMERFVVQLRERELQLEKHIKELEQQLNMIREIRDFTEKELKSDQVVTKEPGMEGYRAFCDNGPAAQRQIARLAELFPMVFVTIDYRLPENWKKAQGCLESRLGICVLKERFGLLDLTDKEGLEEMPAMDSLCMSLVTAAPFALRCEDFRPLLEAVADRGYVPQSGIIASLFCREMAKNQACYLLKCRILVRRV